MLNYGASHRGGVLEKIFGFEIFNFLTIYLVTAAAFQSTPLPRFPDVLKNTPFSGSSVFAEILPFSQRFPGQACLHFYLGVATTEPNPKMITKKRQ